MEMMPVKPERKAELEDYARRHGQDPADALDTVLSDYLEWERRDYLETIEGIRRGNGEVKTDRTRLAGEFMNELRQKHDLPR